MPRFIHLCSPGTTAGRASESVAGAALGTLSAQKERTTVSKYLVVPEYPGPLKLGDKGTKVKLLQEMLVARGRGLKIDGVFGRATEVALEDATGDNRLTTVGWNLLSEGIVDVVSDVYATKSYSVNCRICLVAHSAIEARAREIGGQNRGPWVRLFCGGKDGVAWCAYFATAIAHERGGDIPILGDCNAIARWATKHKAWVDSPSCGDLFLTPRGDGTYQHTGIVSLAYGDVFLTAEGNSNADGDSEGREVCRNYRATKNYRFVSVASKK